MIISGMERSRVNRCLLLAATGILLAFSPFRLCYSQKADNSSKFVGNIIGGSVPRDFATYWDQVTPENAGKWGNVATSQDTNSWNWGPLDKAYDYAISRGFPFKFHNLVWGNQQPGWISNFDSAGQAQMVEAWIRLAGKRYPKTSLIDVVNEPLHAVPDYKNALGGDGSTGWDWVIWAFKAARKYFPNTKLLLNDYNILSSTSETKKYLQIINLLKSRGLIDGIGCQAHFLENTAASTIQANLNLLAQTGLPIYISEYDVDLSDDSAQLAVYKKQFPVFWNDSTVKGITLWGYRQGAMWRRNAYLVRSDGSKRPAFTWLEQYLADNPNPMGINNSGKFTPYHYALNQNYPNPFNPTTTIRFTVSHPYVTTLRVYNEIGQLVATPLNRYLPSGQYSVRINAENWSSGQYFYRLHSGDFIRTHKMLFLK